MKNKLIISLVFLIPLAVFALLQYAAKNAANANVFEQAPGKGKLIKFYSPMCSECKTVGANVKNVMDNYGDIIIYEEIDVSEKTPKNQDMIEAYKITVVPTVVFIDKNGEIENKTEGMIEETEIKNHLEAIK